MGNLPFMPIDPTLLPIPSVSYGLPFPEACAEHIQHTLHASRVYIICSGTLARMTGPETPLQRLISAIGEEHVVGVRRGMAPHTLWSEIIEIASEAKEATADCLVTLGAGSLTDAAKIITMVRDPARNGEGC
jgi:alcohol dehydrogenase class IV